MKIICFSSHTAIWDFAFAEATMASELQKKGHEVLFVTPGNQFTGISNLKQEKILRGEFDLKGYQIGSKLGKNDYKQITSILKKQNKKNFDKLVMNNINIGKLALYEFLLNHKKSNVDLTQEEWKECVICIKNTLISFFACRAIIKKEKPDRILMYNTLYSVNHVWERYAKSRSIPVYFLHHGLNISDMGNTLIIAKLNSLNYFKKLINIWSKLKNVPVSEEMLQYVTDNFLELLKAKHYLVYSSPKSNKHVSTREFFNVKENQKILTATMSSVDELFSAKYVGARDLPKNLIFTNQTDWINQLINYVKERQDLFLIIRVHPREFPNKRESVKSGYAKILESLFENLPDNVKVNWPTDNISMYDLAQETDVFLNAWSSVGVEMSLLGIPVVVYSKELILYPADLNYLAKDSEDYFIKIDMALNDGWSYQRMKKTYRWLVLYYYRTILRFRSENAEFNKFTAISLVFGMLNYIYNLLPSKIKVVLTKILVIPKLNMDRRYREDCSRQRAEHVDISSVENMLKKSEETLVNIKEAFASKISETKEDLYIRNEVKRIYKTLYGNSLKGTKINKNSLQYNLRKTFV